MVICIPIIQFHNTDYVLTNVTHEDPKHCEHCVLHGYSPTLRVYRLFVKIIEHWVRNVSQAQGVGLMSQLYKATRTNIQKVMFTLS